ncbi:hypothetical protein F5Y15DRAFT_60113 [Xylariaceae sp. FL0016]|nr:hypothetical protein F5Y15DRAFT_60113 [Xylariaceae sp. FL0016]
MSSPEYPRPISPSDITCIAADPFEPKPLIADILRTRYCVPGSIFLVEGIDSAYTSRSKRWRLIRLLLGDGELCIQALLASEMHCFVDRDEVAFGSYIKLEDFKLESQNVQRERTAPGTVKGKELAVEPPEDGEEGLLFLIVENFEVVGWNHKLVEPGNAETLMRDAELLDDNEKYNPIEEKPALLESLDEQLPPPSAQVHQHEVSSPDQDIAETDSEDSVIVSTPPKTTEPTRHDLTTTSPKQAPPEVSTINHVPWFSSDTTKPLKLTNLRGIPNLPYKQNWRVNVLAVVSAISDVEPSNLPPYTQRQVRLADPSTDKHVLLTVFLDSHYFTPAVGSVVLLLGVKNHRFDGGSLKKYVSDRPAAGCRWWFEDPYQFSWCDVAGLRKWWYESTSAV